MSDTNDHHLGEMSIPHTHGPDIISSSEAKKIVNTDTESNAVLKETMVLDIVRSNQSSDINLNSSSDNREQWQRPDVEFHITIFGTDFLALIEFVKMVNKGVTNHHNFFYITPKGLLYKGIDTSGTTKALITISRKRVVSFYLDKGVDEYAFCFRLDSVTSNTRHFKTHQVTLGRARGNDNVYITLPGQGDRNLFYLDLINASPPNIEYPIYANKDKDKEPTVVVWAPNLNTPCKNVTTKQRVIFRGNTNSIVLMIANAGNKGGGGGAWRFPKVQNDTSEGEKITVGSISGSVIKLVSKFCALAPNGIVQVFLAPQKPIKFVGNLGHCGKTQLHVDITQA